MPKFREDAEANPRALDMIQLITKIFFIFVKVVITVHSFSVEG